MQLIIHQLPLSNLFKGSVLVCLVAMAKHHTLGSFNNRNVFSQSGDGTSKIRVLPELDSAETAVLGMQMAVSLCPHVASSP